MASIRYVATDIDRWVEFYRDKLGFSVDMHNPGKFAALVREDLTLYLSAPRGRQWRNCWRSCGAWWVEPVHDCHERHRWSHRAVEQRRGQIRGEISEAGAGRARLLEDPSGNLIELFEFKKKKNK